MSEISVIELHATMEALAPVARLAAAGGLRALPAEPRDGQSGGGDPQAFVDRLHQSGDAARARAGWERLQRVPLGERRVLEWLADRGDARPTVREVCGLLAREHGPVALRDAVDRARAQREETERAHGTAARNARVITEPVAKLRDLLTLRRVIEERCVTRLAEWGRPVLASALVAWRATENRAEPRANGHISAGGHQ